MATSLTEIIKNPNYVNANPETQRAIFEKYAPLDPNYSNANAATQEAIRSKFGITQSKFAPSATPADIPGAIPQPTVEEPSFGARVAAIPETVARTIYGGLTGLIGAPIALGQEIITGTPKEQTFGNIMALGGRVPMSAGAQANLQTLGDLTSGLPAFVPAIGQAGQVAQGVNALAARTTPAMRNTVNALVRTPETKATQPSTFPAALPISPAAPAASVGAQRAKNNPFSGITGEETARGNFPSVKQSKTAADVAVPEQETRATIAAEILGDVNRIRPGVLTGNENTLRTEYTEAKMPQPTPSGELLKRQLADEQTALSRYAQQRVENTGASRTLMNPYERGERINSALFPSNPQEAPYEGLTGALNLEKRNLYNEVKSKVGANPIASTHVSDLLKDKQFRAGLGLKGNEGVASSAEELIKLAKTIGFRDESGVVHAPNTVDAWVAVQKSLNQDWTPNNAKVIKRINEAIEKDIGAAGGIELLKKADNLHRVQKTLFESKGIKDLFGSVDPNGVQTGVDFEKIPQKMNNMPFDQWRHIYDLVDSVANGKIPKSSDFVVSPELQQAAAAARAEIKGNIAREIYESGSKRAGVWNAEDANKTMNARDQKIRHAFDPDEQRAFHVLNYGGYLMPGSLPYEGAGLQSKRVGAIISSLPTTGQELGALSGVPFASTAGRFAGTKLQGFLGGKNELKRAKELEEQMTQNALIGQRRRNP
jgi:hypothetical protein